MKKQKFKLASLILGFGLLISGHELAWACSQDSDCGCTKSDKTKCGFLCSQQTHTCLANSDMPCKNSNQCLSGVCDTGNYGSYCT